MTRLQIISYRFNESLCPGLSLICFKLSFIHKTELNVNNSIGFCLYWFYLCWFLSTDFGLHWFWSLLLLALVEAMWRSRRSRSVCPLPHPPPLSPIFSSSSFLSLFQKTKIYRPSLHLCPHVSCDLVLKHPQNWLKFPA